MRVLGALAAALFLWPTLALAQSTAPSTGPELLGSLAVTTLWDDESKLGTGVAAGGGAGYRWRNGLGVELRVEGFSNSRTFSSGVQFDASGTRLLGQVAYYWSDGKVQPFAAGTFGVLNVKQRSEYPVVERGPNGSTGHRRHRGVREPPHGPGVGRRGWRTHPAERSLGAPT